MCVLIVHLGIRNGPCTQVAHFFYHKYVSESAIGCCTAGSVRKEKHNGESH
jgi:hypothetical protein